MRAVTLDRFDMSLGAGLGKVKDRVFRIGHLGHSNDLSLMGALSGVRWGCRRRACRCKQGGAQAAMDVLLGKDAAAPAQQRAA